MLLLLAFLLTFLALPLAAMVRKSFENRDGAFVGFANYVTYFASPSLSISLWNSFFVATITTIIVLPVAFVFAFALTRSHMAGKAAFRAIVLIPVLAPSLLPAIALVYLFGNQGIARWALMGHSIYGPIGIVIAQVFFNLPQAVMLLVATLSMADRRLYESAAALKTSRLRIWLTVTWPEVRFGLASCALVTFVKVVTDFGSPIVIGGGYNVLATDIYKQVVGQLDFGMGAVIGVVLMIPAIAAFLGNQAIQRRQQAVLTARSVPYAPAPSPLRDTGLFAFCALVAVFMLVILGVAVWGSFVTYWPYNLALSLRNYDFATVDPSGWAPFLNAIKMAALTSAIGTIIVFVGAYALEKTKGFRMVCGLLATLAMMPLAVPGLVLGLAYVIFFNARANPLEPLLGTLLLMAIGTLVHYYTVCHLTAVTALKQLDREFEAVSESLKVSLFRTFMRVTMPICLPAIIEIAGFFFLAAMASVSVLIFIYAPDSRVASVAVVNINDAGFTAAAAAMASCIVIACAIFKIAHGLLSYLVLRSAMAWRAGKSL
ncbi:MAG: putative 2-aminoethylphosphonate ABC transporter permease subunit [Novosphingobium sp.]|uniref:putative 2-aminoethylphosphonate ABC transporter permease subunit n=1 Tax=Novosphingobium sp. TaxID=1874826 RepID=UPI0022C92BDC|nr:putative 2-aminoethylphosphonate ABC transporter permease subunit [Novosphingobium sp.]MCZ8036359.1 putative 2-aminoethylphosphonate ABC transporter permease subunit [Novosphingobium sp.]